MSNCRGNYRTIDACLPSFRDEPSPQGMKINPRVASVVVFVVDAHGLTVFREPRRQPAATNAPRRHVAGFLEKIGIWRFASRAPL
jgi:hypothetical protein